MYIGLHIKYRYSRQISMKVVFSPQIKKKKEKYSNIQLHENPSIGRRIVPRGRAHTNRRAGGHDKANSRLP
jgi:hypothetical protein